MKSTKNEAIKGIIILIKRFFLGTPKSEVNTSIQKEINYLRQALKQQIRINKSLLLRLELTQKTK